MILVARQTEDIAGLGDHQALNPKSIVKRCRIRVLASFALSMTIHTQIGKIASDENPVGVVSGDEDDRSIGQSNRSSRRVRDCKLIATLGRPSEYSLRRPVRDKSNGGGWRGVLCERHADAHHRSGNRD